MWVLNMFYRAQIFTLGSDNKSNQNHDSGESENKLCKYMKTQYGVYNDEALTQITDFKLHNPIGLWLADEILIYTNEQNVVTEWSVLRPLNG